MGVPVFGLFLLVVLLILGVGIKSPAAAAALLLAATVAYLFLPDPAGPAGPAEEEAGLALAAATAEEPAGPEALEFVESEPVTATMPPALRKPEAAGLPGTWGVGPNAALAKADPARESEWLEASEHSIVDAQKHDRDVHRALRRDTLWSATSKWTPEDKLRYETMRRRVESKIASGLRPDGNMVVEDDPDEDKTPRSDQPWGAIGSQDQSLFHSAGFLRMSQGTGDLASRLRTKI